MAQANQNSRDRSRRPDAKRRALTRRGERVAKSARLFLAFAFPAELDCFAPTANA